MVSALQDEFFNLLRTSESRWVTLHIEGRTWLDVDVQNLAWQAQINRMKVNGARFAVFRSTNPEKEEATKTAVVKKPLENEQTWRLWASPQRRRAQFYVGEEIVDVVIEGSTFWSNGHGRSITNSGKENIGHGQGDGQNLIETASYASLLHVARISEGMKDGRRTIDARVTILDDEHHKHGRGVHGLTIGDPDYLELRLDRERGVVLSASSWLDASLYRIVEMTRCEFDLVFARDVYDIESGFGPEWESV
jgi:hypothetical protein